MESFLARLSKMPRGPAVLPEMPIRVMIFTCYQEAFQLRDDLAASSATSSTTGPQLDLPMLTELLDSIQETLAFIRSHQGMYDLWKWGEESEAGEESDACPPCTGKATCVGRRRWWQVNLDQMSQPVAATVATSLRQWRTALRRTIKAHARARGAREAVASFAAAPDGGDDEAEAADLGVYRGWLALARRRDGDFLERGTALCRSLAAALQLHGLLSCCVAHADVEEAAEARLTLVSLVSDHLADALAESDYAGDGMGAAVRAWWLFLAVVALPDAAARLPWHDLTEGHENALLLTPGVADAVQLTSLSQARDLSLRAAGLLNRWVVRVADDVSVRPLDRLRRVVAEFGAPGGPMWPLFAMLTSSAAPRVSEVDFFQAMASVARATLASCDAFLATVGGADSLADAEFGEVAVLYVMLLLAGQDGQRGGGHDDGPADVEAPIAVLRREWASRGRSERTLTTAAFVATLTTPDNVVATLAQLPGGSLVPLTKQVYHRLAATSASMAAFIQELGSGS